MDEAGLFVIEGEKFIEEIAAGWEKVSVICSESYVKSKPGAAGRHAAVLVVKDSLFGRISETKNPQGVMAVCRKKCFDPDAVFGRAGALLIYAEEINDPGNLGTIIRTAHACGACGVFTSDNSADAYNPKVLRASAGSFFHIPVFERQSLNSFAEKCAAKKIKITAADTGGRESPYEIDFTKNTAIMIGNEARGLSREAVCTADHLVRIPMPGGAESLNASVACAVLLYEATRQRLAAAK